jgi:hypothetical protein
MKGGATPQIVVQFKEVLGRFLYSLGLNSSLVTITLPLFIMGFASDPQHIFKRGLSSEPR